MRILFLTHAFNSLTQRLFVELSARGHEVSIEFDINDRVTAEAVDLFQPQLILAPYLRRAIPESVWRQHLCLIVHPGIVGDRGPSALDWAIQAGVTDWGVTVLQAEAEMDAGPVWATQTFPLRAARKSSLYRNEVTEAAVSAVFAALERLPGYLAGNWRPMPLDAANAPGQFHPLLTQSGRTIDWMRDDSMTVLAKLNAADGFPGVLDVLFEHPCHLFNARAYPAAGTPGTLLGRAGEGIVRATADGAVWIGHVRRAVPKASMQPAIKLPATLALPQATELTELDVTPIDDIRYEEIDAVGYLHFDFYNGAMGTQACQRLLAAFEAAQKRPTRIIVLMGGADFFSNGLDLSRIEAASSPADESWRNINAMDDLCQAVITCETHLTLAALQGNAGAGGAFLALAADHIWARSGVLLNPHYKNMGNLYGSEFWTYLLPRRVGSEHAGKIMQNRLPLSAENAVCIGFLDACFGATPAEFAATVRRRAATLASTPEFAQHLRAKVEKRAADEDEKPLATWRAEELRQMQRNFFGFDPSYHVARHHFIAKTPHSWTPRHLAKHRELGWSLKATDPVA